MQEENHRKKAGARDQKRIPDALKKPSWYTLLLSKEEVLTYLFYFTVFSYYSYSYPFSLPDYIVILCNNYTVL
jgi:hypothetical protein